MMLSVSFLCCVPARAVQKMSCFVSSCFLVVSSPDVKGAVMGSMCKPMALAILGDRLPEVTKNKGRKKQ